jgi:hypothetical protein
MVQAIPAHTVTDMPALIFEARISYWSQETYTSQLRSSIYGLWRGALSISSFVEAFTGTVFTGLSSAWFSGARAAGIERDEMTDAENQALQVALFQQMTYIGGLANYVYLHSQANDFKLSVPMSRLGLWSNRYKEFYIKGMVMAKADPKYTWVLGPTDKHCQDCVRISGKTKRSSQWLKSGWMPRSNRLFCGGYNCQCDLIPTTMPMSKGNLPRLP